MDLEGGPVELGVPSADDWYAEIFGSDADVMRALSSPGETPSDRARASRRSINLELAKNIDVPTSRRVIGEMGVTVIVMDLVDGNSFYSPHLNHADYALILRSPAPTGDDGKVSDGKDVVGEFPPLMFLLATGRYRSVNHGDMQLLINATGPDPFMAGNPWCEWIARRLATAPILQSWIFKTFSPRLLASPSTGAVIGDSYLHFSQRVGFASPPNLHTFMTAFTHLARRAPGIIFVDSRFAVFLLWFKTTLIDDTNPAFASRSTTISVTMENAVGWMTLLAVLAMNHRRDYIDNIKALNEPLNTPRLSGNPALRMAPILFTAAAFASPALFQAVYRSLTARERTEKTRSGSTLAERLKGLRNRRRPAERQAYDSMLLVVNRDYR